MLGFGSPNSGVFFCVCFSWFQIGPISYGRHQLFMFCDVVMPRSMRGNPKWKFYSPMEVVTEATGGANPVKKRKMLRNSMRKDAAQPQRDRSRVTETVT